MKNDKKKGLPWGTIIPTLIVVIIFGLMIFSGTQQESVHTHGDGASHSHD